MSLRRAPPCVHAVGPVGLVAAAPTEASRRMRALNRQAIHAQLGSMTRRLQREPIGQMNPFLVGRQNMILDELKRGGGGGGNPPSTPAPRIVKAEQQIEELKAAMRQLQKKTRLPNSEKQEEAEAQKAEIDKMQFEFAQLQQDVEILQKSLNKRMAGMARKRKEDRVYERLDTLEQESNATKELQAKLKANTEELELLRNYNTQRKGNLMREIDSLWADKIELEEELEKSKSLTGVVTSAPWQPNGLTTDIAQLNPWLANFRDKLRKAQKEAVQDDENLRKELENYQLVIQNLREKLSKSREDGDAQRTALIGALELQLEQEVSRVQDLVKKLDDKTDESTNYETQLSTASAELSRSTAALQEVEDKLSLSEKEVVRMTVQAAVAHAEFEALEEKLKEADRTGALSAAERAALRVQVDSMGLELSASETTLEEYKQEAEKAANEFDDELDRNKQLLDEMKSRRATLEKEVSALNALNQRPVVAALV